MAFSKPTMLLVHSAWHHPSCWEPVQKSLSEVGYTSRASALVSPGSPSPGAGLRQDVEVVRKDLEELVAQGKDVVMVMHSYGGMAGGGAVEGLEKSRRREAGKTGGVTGCVFIAAFLVPKGKSLIAAFPAVPPYLIPHPDDPEHFLTVTDAHEIWYQDVSREFSHQYVSGLRPQPKATFEEAAESVPWESGLVPCTYIMCEKDQGVFPFLQEVMLEARKEDSPVPFAVERMATSHCGWLGRPQEMSDPIIKVASSFGA